MRFLAEEAVSLYERMVDKAEEYDSTKPTKAKFGYAHVENET